MLSQSIKKMHRQTSLLKNTLLSDHSHSTAKDFASSYHFCIVFPSDKDGHFDNKGKEYMSKLEEHGFELFIFKGVDEKILVLGRAPQKILESLAARKEIELQLDAEEIRKMMERGNPEKDIEPVFIPHDPDITLYHPYQYIYGKFAPDKTSLYAKENGSEEVFRDTTILKLDKMILESKMPSGGQNLKIRRYLRQGSLLGVFPLHNREKCQALEQKWTEFPTKKKQQPRNDIKDYFGEDIALYFVFLEHYTKLLWIPAVVGIPLQISIFATGRYSSLGYYILPTFAFLVSLWGIVVLELWKRKQATLSLEWGTNNFQENESDRADFKAETRASFIDGQQIRYFPDSKRRLYIAQSIFATFVLICLVVGVVVSIYVIRFAAQSEIGYGNAQTLASVLNAVQIQVLNLIYGFVAVALTDRENHRTTTDHTNSMIAKTFIFQFVNSYASFFYLAFIAEGYGDCPEDGGCMKTLAINLAIIYGSRLLIGNLTNLVLPFIQYAYKRETYKEKYKETGLTRPEQESLLVPYDDLEVALVNYSNIAIEFGYLALFVSALPMASLFAFVSNIGQIRGNAWKLLHVYQRPFPEGSEDIGMWQDIFLVIITAAVVTNAGLAVFTMHTFNDLDVRSRFWIFVVFQWLVFGLQQVIMAAIPDIPDEIEIQIRRMKFITSKVIDEVPDEKKPEYTPSTQKEFTFNTYPADSGESEAP